MYLWLVAVVGLTFVFEAFGHPQCLDFAPPFRAIGKSGICDEYEDFTCCNVEEETEIGRKFNQISLNLTQKQLTSCGNFLKSLLCQKCSPYAAHIYDAEIQLKPNKFPGLCPAYCKRMMRKCSFLVGMVTNESALVALAQKRTSKDFCKAIGLSDMDYCYPKLKTNQLFNKGLGSAQFYRKKNPFTSTSQNCVPLCVEEVANGLLNPLSLKHANDDTQRIFVVEQIGVVWIYLSDKSRLSKSFLNLRDIVLVKEQEYDERGMLDIVFHPDYKNNGRFFLYYSILTGGDHHIKISEMRVSDNDMNRANLTTERTLLTVREPANNHNGGMLLFGGDGYLYIFTGDGGAGGDPFGPVGNAQNKKSFLGKVLRVDVNLQPSDARAYAIPSDNPFVGNKEYLPEIYAIGIRNMWRCGMDRGNSTGYNKGRIFCGDVGQSQYEEIDIITKGGNYGWRAYEGNSCYDTNLCNKHFIPNHVRPIHVYDHSIGTSVTGGYVYRGCRNPNLYGKYIFGDFSFGKLFLLHETATGKWVREEVCMGSSEICKNGGLQNHYANFILSFGEDEKGEVYMLSTSDPLPGRLGGSVYRLVDPSRRGDPSSCHASVEKTVIADGTTAVPYSKGN